MRTTVTLDPDTHALIQRAMKERGLSFKAAVNDAIRRGLTGGGEKPAIWTFPTYDMGKPLVDLEDKDAVEELAMQEYRDKQKREHER